MAVAFDASSNANTGTSAAASPFEWTHTPTGTPRAALVWVVQSGITALNSGACSYGGTSMTKVAEVAHATGEGGVVYFFFLGASVPAGAQTVSFTHTASSIKFGGAATLTATGDVEVIDSDNTVNSDSVVDPSVTLSLGGRTCFAAIGFFSGQAAVTGITPLTSWTDRGEHDFTANVAGFYTYDTIGTTDITAGWTQGADDAVAIAAAVSEIVTAAAPKSQLLLGVG